MEFAYYAYHKVAFPHVKTIRDILSAVFPQEQNQLTQFEEREQQVARAIYTLPRPKGIFQEMASRPAKDDRYLKQLAPELYKYEKGVIGRTFDIDVYPTRSIPNLENISVPITVLAAIALGLAINDLSDQEDSTTISVREVVMFAEVSVHHSTILINEIASHIAKRESCPDRFLGKLRSLKVELLNLNLLLEKVLMSYTHLTDTQPPAITEVRNATNKVKNILKRMKLEDLDKLFPPGHHGNCRYQVTYDDILCSILGLGETLGQQFEMIPVEERSHQTDEYLIKEMLQDLYDNVMDDDTVLDKEHTFLGLAFTESKAKLLSSLLITNTLKNNQTILYWTQRFIENVFQYDILLQDIVMPLEATHAEVWRVNTEGRVPTDVDVSPQIVVPPKLVKSEKEVLAFASLISDDGSSVVLFHGTDEISARHIVDNGIMLGRGNLKQDFSDGSGFYVTTDPKMAFEWARFGNFAPYAAVVAFKVEKQVLEDYKKLDLAIEETEWKDVVSYNRSGRDRIIFKPPSATKQKYHEADYVEGLVCGSAGVLERALEPNHDRYAQGSYQQICILSDKMAERVGDIQNIYVCFFDKSHL